jgi:hypothetical protein
MHLKTQFLDIQEATTKFHRDSTLLCGWTNSILRKASKTQVLLRTVLAERLIAILTMWKTSIKNVPVRGDSGSCLSYLGLDEEK